MTNVTQKFAVLGLLTGLSAGLAQAEEVDISVGAHAFMDYENAAIDGEELVNGVNLRVFRVDLNGSKDNLTFKSNVDFAGDSVSIKDLFFEFSGDTNLRVGNFKVMNGLEQSSSLYSTTFTEASSVAKINGIGRSLGVGAFHSKGAFNFSAGLFGPDANDTGDQDVLSASGRVTYSVQPSGKDSVLHLGISTRYRKTGAEDAPFSFSQKPFAASTPKTIKTPAISDSDIFLGLEGAYVLGGLSFQSEYGYTTIDCRDQLCTDDPIMQAYYLDASYMWGGHRKYKAGLFKRDVVDGPGGAYALSIRYDVADLNDANIQGGRQDTVVLGGTWYRDNNLRIMLNYSHSELEDSPIYGNETADAVVIRAQFEIG